MTPLVAFALLSALAAADDKSPERRRIVIPDQVFIEFSTETDTPPADAEELALRAKSHAPVAVGDPIDLVGHIERVEETTLSIVGRIIDIRFADVRGGSRKELIAGALVRVRGTGGPKGQVVAETLELQPGRDPGVWSRLEREIDEFEKKYWQKQKRYDDPELQRYLEGIARRLLPPYLPKNEQKFALHVVQDPSLNAFALPDGSIVLHTGIIARMENEAQLAAIVGHELAHYTQRHALRYMQKETQHKILGWGSLLATLALGMAGEGDAAKGVELMSAAWTSGYSRNHEDEADKVGLRYMYLAGYDVREAPKVWQTFQLLYGNPSREANFFYGSHSRPEDRQHHLSAEIWKAYEPSKLIGGRVGREEFLNATARLVRDNAILDLDRGNRAWAEWGMAKSLAVAPEDSASYVALGKLELSRGRGKDALRAAADAFSRAIELQPDNAAAHRELGFVWKRLGETELARQALSRYLDLAPDADDAAQVKREL